MMDFTDSFDHATDRAQPGQPCLPPLPRWARLKSLLLGLTLLTGLLYGCGCTLYALWQGAGEVFTFLFR